MAGTIRRCAVLLIGRNSVNPCTMPRTIACQNVTVVESAASKLMDVVGFLSAEERLRESKYSVQSPTVRLPATIGRVDAVEAAAKYVII
jgi:hypothetical protein